MRCLPIIKSIIKTSETSIGMYQAPISLSYMPSLRTLYNLAQSELMQLQNESLHLAQDPFSSYAEYIENSDIKEAKEVADSKKMVEIIRDNLNILLD
jgi:hypothetical protein